MRLSNLVNNTRSVTTLFYPRFKQTAATQHHRHRCYGILPPLPNHHLVRDQVNEKLRNRDFIHHQPKFLYPLHSILWDQVRTMNNEKISAHSHDQVTESKELVDEAKTTNDDNDRTSVETLNKDQSQIKKLGTADKLKLAIRDYGGTVLVFHVTMSLMSLGSCYVLISGGLDIIGLLERLGVSETFLQSKITQGGSTFVLAYAIHKVFAPVRLGITLTAVPFIVKKLRRIGFLKTPV